MTTTTFSNNFARYVAAPTLGAALIGAAALGFAADATAGPGGTTPRPPSPSAGDTDTSAPQQRVGAKKPGAVGSNPVNTVTTTENPGVNIVTTTQQRGGGMTKTAPGTPPPSVTRSLTIPGSASAFVTPTKPPVSAPAAAPR